MTATMHDLSRDVNGSSVPTPGSWVIDGSHSSAEFVARHLMVTKVRGGFNSGFRAVDSAFVIQCKHS